jgi:hypothetical protein
MGRATHVLAVGAAVIATSITVRADGQRQLTLDVRLVLGGVHIERAVIEEAKADVIRIFHAAGVAIRWNGTTSNDTEPAEFYIARSLLVLVRNTADPRVPANALGMAPHTAHGRGRLALIFWNRVCDTTVRNIDRHVVISRTLAIAIAHELGHLLLPAGHSTAGLMKATWDARDFKMASRNSLLFTPEDTQHIRNRLGTGESVR